ncbi:MAG: DNA polymerase III subunit delta [Endomicrobium sp.]|jgi:DNA polymerase-3 subunit delta|nr:DNA polymerase III subunit delta [Endomicrobium sp.]
MQILKVHDFNKLILNKHIFPVYLFMCEELYLFEMCLNKLKKQIDMDSSNNVDQDYFYLPESSIENIVSTAYTSPFFNKKRIIIVKGINEMKGVDIEKFTNYLLNITNANTSLLVLVYFGNFKNDLSVKRKTFINKCITSQKCICVNCEKPCNEEVKKFIKTEFIKRKKIISDDLISRIIDKNGTDLLNLSNEIEKIALFLGKNQKIKDEDLEKIYGYVKDSNINKLLYNIDNKDFKNSIYILEKLLNENVNCTMILSAISSNIRKMIIAKSMVKEQNMSINEIASSIRISNSYVNIFFINLKKHNVNTLKRSLKMILDADIAIKTVCGDIKFSLLRIILLICGE